MRYLFLPPSKYFCQSEAVAYYLQKYVVYRKRKVYVGTRTFSDLIELIAKHKSENFLLPCSDVLKPSVPEALDKLEINWTKGVFYNTVISDLSDLRDVYYDILVFFSPSGLSLCFTISQTFNKTIHVLLCLAIVQSKLLKLPICESIFSHQPLPTLQ